jgi:drug/metabolite transporter (DMT)-like permease
VNGVSDTLSVFGGDLIQITDNIYYMPSNLEQPMNNKEIKTNVLFLAGVTAIMWGLTGIFIHLLHSIHPLIIIMIRLSIALGVITPFFLLSPSNRKKLKLASIQPVAYFLSFLLIGYYLLATIAFQMSSVAEAALFISASPLFILIFRWVKNDTPALIEIVGALISISGISLIVMDKINTSNSISLYNFIGDISAMCAAALTAFYSYTYSNLNKNNTAPETIGISMLTFALGTITLTLIVFSTSISLEFKHIDSKAILPFLGLGILSTAIPTIGFAVASKHLPAIITSTISLFIPIFAGLFAFLILDEILPTMFIPGSILVLGGIAMIVHKNSKAK